ncbi:MAG: alcohol dehydrogenase catalytic domain-containing protein [Actinobacteria bacterium]|nr:alcohol dehydrogenase catalytic domain-containing protein [Actinomycetota bacterium]
MLQAIMTKPGVIVYKEIEKPKPKGNEVLIKIKRIGICGSDIHVYHGTHPFTDYPIVQGHEVYGEISDIGHLVKDFSIGDKVTIMPQVTCGECYNCKNGKYNICDSLKVMGFQINGAAQDYYAVPDKLVIKLSENILPEEGAMIEPTAVAVHALKRGGSVKGKNILVLGSGTIGNLVGQVAKGLGAKKVINSDIIEFRLNIAKQCGIDLTINPMKYNLEKAIIKEFGENKADMILECVGAETTVSQAISYARKGTNIIIVGVFSQKPKIDMSLIQDRELNIIGTLMYQKDDYLKAIELIEEGKLLLKNLVTKIFPFLEYQNAYRYIEKKNGLAMKVMVTFN